MLKNCSHFHHETNGYSIETTDGRTLWQDSLFLRFSITIGNEEYVIITQIVTCTGQERFLATREYIIHGADGIVFVGDSNPAKMEENKRSFRKLLAFSKPNQIPYIVQLNKRDIENAVEVKLFKAELGLPEEDQYENGKCVLYPATALEGKNVIEAFNDIIFTVIRDYFLR